jgi:hypothetical protein
MTLLEEGILDIREENGHNKDHDPVLQMVAKTGDEEDRAETIKSSYETDKTLSLFDPANYSRTQIRPCFRNTM